MIIQTKPISGLFALAVIVALTLLHGCNYEERWGIGFVSNPDSWISKNKDNTFRLFWFKNEDPNIRIHDKIIKKGAPSGFIFTGTRFGGDIFLFGRTGFAFPNIRKKDIPDTFESVLKKGEVLPSDFPSKYNVWIRHLDGVNIVYAFKHIDNEYYILFEYWENDKAVNENDLIKCTELYKHK